tara:strand:+ start:236 stop:1021 length:786 start_codon:yes stop_codon:yes gene_type:complete
MSKDLNGDEILASEYLSHRLYKVYDPDYPFNPGGIRIAELENEDPFDIDAMIIGGNPAGNTNVGRDGTYIANKSKFTKNNLTWLQKSGLMRKGGLFLFTNIFSRVSPSFSDIYEAYLKERNNGYPQLNFLKNMIDITNCPVLTQFGTPWKDSGVRYGSNKMSGQQKDNIKSHILLVCRELFAKFKQEEEGNKLPRKLVAPWGLSTEGVPIHYQGRRDKGGLKYDVGKEILFNATHFVSMGNVNMHGYAEPEGNTLEKFFYD